MSIVKKMYEGTKENVKKVYEGTKKNITWKNLNQVNRTSRYWLRVGGLMVGVGELTYLAHDLWANRKNK